MPRAGNLLEVTDGCLSPSPSTEPVFWTTMVTEAVGGPPRPLARRNTGLWQACRLCLRRTRAVTAVNGESYVGTGCPLGVDGNSESASCGLQEGGSGPALGPICLTTTPLFCPASFAPATLA